MEEVFIDDFGMTILAKWLGISIFMIKAGETYLLPKGSKLTILDDCESPQRYFGETIMTRRGIFYGYTREETIGDIVWLQDKEIVSPL